MSTFALLTHSQPDDVVALSHERKISAAHFLADVRQLATALPPGQHVLNACADRYRFAVGFAAALFAKKISLLPPTLTTEMVQQLKIFAPDVFCLTDQSQAIDLPQFAWAVGVPCDQQSADDLDIAWKLIPQIPAQQTAAIVFTSGSTGTPVAHHKSWGALVQSVRAEAHRLGLQGGKRYSIVATVPPQHMFGFESSVLIALQSGSTISATHPFFPADICAALQAAERPRLLVTTPVHLRVLLGSGLAIPTLDGVLSATAPLSPQLAQQAENHLRTPLREIYGSTETGQIASRRSTETAEWTLFPGVQLKRIGTQVWASGGHVEKSVPMGDELELLDAQRFLLHGRTTDLINIAGKRSSLGYLNHQLNAIPGVVDGAFLMPEESGDSVVRLAAFAVAPGLDATAILSALRERIDTIFMPRPLVLLDALPRNSTGKLPREILLALLHTHQQGSSTCPAK